MGRCRGRWPMWVCREDGRKLFDWSCLQVANDGSDRATRVAVGGDDVVSIAGDDGFWNKLTVQLVEGDVDLANFNGGCSFGRRFMCVTVWSW